MDKEWQNIPLASLQHKKSSGNYAITVPPVIPHYCELEEIGTSCLNQKDGDFGLPGVPNHALVQTKPRTYSEHSHVGQHSGQSTKKISEGALWSGHSLGRKHARTLSSGQLPEKTDDGTIWLWQDQTPKKANDGILKPRQSPKKCDGGLDSFQSSKNTSISTRFSPLGMSQTPREGCKDTYLKLHFDEPSWLRESGGRDTSGYGFNSPHCDTTWNSSVYGKILKCMLHLLRVCTVHQQQFFWKFW